MTMLTIWPDASADEVLLQTEDPARITAELASVGVGFERWRATVELAADASAEAVLAAYQSDIERLKQGGYSTVDVVRVTPDHPDRAALRKNFLAEHTHADDEVRFFVEGSGAFYLRLGGRVFQVICERDDLIRVPADTRHWFDTGARPHFAAIRWFASPDGWVGRFTGDPIAARFPEFDR